MIAWIFTMLQKPIKSWYVGASFICYTKFHIVLKGKMQECIIFPKIKLPYFHSFFLDEK